MPFFVLRNYPLVMTLVACLSAVPLHAEQFTAVVDGPAHFERQFDVPSGSVQFDIFSGPVLSSGGGSGGSGGGFGGGGGGGGGGSSGGAIFVGNGGTLQLPAKFPSGPIVPTRPTFNIESLHGATIDHAQLSVQLVDSSDASLFDDADLMSELGISPSSAAETSATYNADFTAELQSAIDAGEDRLELQFGLLDSAPFADVIQFADLLSGTIDARIELSALYVGPAEASSTVPEPTVMLVWTAGAVGWFVRRRIKKRKETCSRAA